MEFYLRIDKMQIAEVILDNDIGKPLDYIITKEIKDKLKIGMRVEVPIKKTSIKKGFVIGLKDKSAFLKLKPIKKIIEGDIKLPKDLITIAFWISKYYCCSINKAFKCIVPASVRNIVKPSKSIILELNLSKKKALLASLNLQKKAPIQSQFINLLIEKNQVLQKDIKLSLSSIKSLLEKKIIKKIEKEKSDDTLLLEKCSFFQTKEKKLTQEQQICLNRINDNIQNNKYETTLLHGVTGSGKTEIYLQAIKKALEKGLSSLLLVPEIALTSQLIEKVKSRFIEKIAVLHYKKSHGEKYDTWMKIINNEVKIIIGARSAIFSPISNLGLIILDEEHDSSYKQSDEMPCYHTRHIALMRGKLSNCPIVLGSATPDMTSFYKSQQKDYSINTLTERATSFIPKVTIVNMNDRKERQNTYSIFSSSLLTKIEQRLKKGEQIILFLNRRGFYNFLFCKNCSNVVKCPHCDMSLTYHKKENKLICHYCYFKKNPTKECPNCNDSYMQYKGFGTENIESSIKNIFPTIKTLRMDKDTTSTKNSHEDLFKQFRNGKADILIGTQMVIKGFHFPSVTLVGILNSDSTLNIPDFRSSENLFQMLTQAAGRAGRELNTGEVIIQTFLPKNKTILLSAKQDYNAFYNEEIIFRKLFTYPPFSSIIKILFIGDDEKKTKEGLLIFRKKTINSLSKDCIIHPIQASGKLKIKDRFRFFFLIRTHNILSTTKTLTTLKNQVNKNLKMLIDVDPLTTFF